MKNFEKKRTGIRIPIYLDEELKELANRDGISKNALILGILKNFIESEKRKEELKNEQSFIDR